MPIDLMSETVITFGEAASLLPRRRRGRKVSIQTFYRWAGPGVRGVILETLRTPSGLVTSREALQRFMERLSEARQAAPGSPAPARRSAAQRLRADAKAASELASMGVR